MRVMLSLDQIRRELIAIHDFDALYLTATEHSPEETMGFTFRQLRRQELLDLAKSLASTS